MIKKWNRFWELLSSLILEDDRKSISHRKFIALVCVGYLGWMISNQHTSNNGELYSDITWVSIVGGALGISYIRQLANFKGVSNENNPRDYSRTTTDDIVWGENTPEQGKGSKGNREKGQTD